MVLAAVVATVALAVMVPAVVAAAVVGVGERGAAGDGERSGGDGDDETAGQAHGCSSSGGGGHCCDPPQAPASRAGRGQPSLLMTAIVAPEAMASPSLTASSAMTPALWAVISFSIFIASMMQTSWPSSTACPASTSTFHMLPCRGETQLVAAGAPAAVGALRALGLRGAGAAPPR